MIELPLVRFQGGPFHDQVPVFSKFNDDGLLHLSRPSEIFEYKLYGPSFARLVSHYRFDRKYKLLFIELKGGPCCGEIAEIGVDGFDGALPSELTFTSQVNGEAGRYAPSVDDPYVWWMIPEGEGI